MRLLHVGTAHTAALLEGPSPSFTLDTTPAQRLGTRATVLFFEHSIQLQCNAWCTPTSRILCRVALDIVA